MSPSIISEFSVSARDSGRLTVRFILNFHHTHIGKLIFLRTPLVLIKNFCHSQV